MKCIIYYRKSTDRDDKQANSLEHQINNCRKTAELNNLEIYKEFGESKSAKTEFKRDMFNEMIRLCKLKKVDYIICDEPKRLSRNNIDTSRLIDLLDKKQIKGILGTSREYHEENSRDKFLLQLDLSLSKMDNEDRAKDTKDKMITAFKKGQWLGRAPIGYKNRTIRKGHHDVIIDTELGPIIKRAFELRVKGYSYTKVCDYLYENGIITNTGRKFTAERAKHILNNTFYMGFMKWDGLVIKGNHKPLITEELYYKACEHNKVSVITNKKRVYKLSGIIKDLDGIGLSGYTKKGHIYYHQANRSRYKVSINEEIVFSKFGEILRNFKLEKSLPKITLSILKDIYSKVKESNNINLDKTKLDIKGLEYRKSSLVDSFLDGDIEKQLYKTKLSELDIKIAELNKKLQAPIKITDIKLKKIEKYSELFKNLYTSNNGLIVEEKLNILKSLNSELFVSTKKELHIAESRLLQLLRKVCLCKWQPLYEQHRTF